MPRGSCVCGDFVYELNGPPVNVVCKGHPVCLLGLPEVLIHLGRRSFVIARHARKAVDRWAHMT
jgi:hypothetical protein